MPDRISAASSRHLRNTRWCPASLCASFQHTAGTHFPRSTKNWRGLLFPDANETLSKAGAMYCFHLPSNLVIALFRGFPNRLPIETKFVPIDFAAFIDGHGLLSLLR